MPFYTKDRFLASLEEFTSLPTEKIFLFFGEPFLCEMAAKRVIHRILKDRSNLQIFDGRELDSQLLEEKLTSSFLGKLHIIWIKRLASTSIFTRKMLENPINYLIITTPYLKDEIPDFLQKKAIIVDFSIKATDRQTQISWIKQVINGILKKYNKRITPRAEQALIERIGFNLFLIEQQLELLINYIGEGSSIDKASVEALVPPSKEEMVFKLIEKIVAGNVTDALEGLHRVLEQDRQPLAILGILSNELRNLFEARVFCERFNIFPEKLSFQDFQEDVYPLLEKEKLTYLKGFHPYVIYQIFRRVRYFDIEALKDIHHKLAEADILLKTTQINPIYLLENIVIKWANSIKN